MDPVIEGQLATIRGQRLGRLRAALGCVVRRPDIEVELRAFVSSVLEQDDDLGAEFDRLIEQGRARSADVPATTEACEVHS